MEAKVMCFHGNRSPEAASSSHPTSPSGVAAVCVTCAVPRRGRLRLSTEGTGKAAARPRPSQFTGIRGENRASDAQPRHADCIRQALWVSLCGRSTFAFTLGQSQKSCPIARCDAGAEPSEGRHLESRIPPARSPLQPHQRGRGDVQSSASLWIHPSSIVLAAELRPRVAMTPCGPRDAAAARCPR